MQHQVGMKPNSLFVTSITKWEDRETFPLIVNRPHILHSFEVLDMCKAHIESRLDMHYFPDRLPFLLYDRSHRYVPISFAPYVIHGYLVAHLRGRIREVLQWMRGRHQQEGDQARRVGMLASTESIVPTLCMYPVYTSCPT